jgi:hypothetical protein
MMSIPTINPNRHKNKEKTRKGGDKNLTMFPPTQKCTTPDYMPTNSEFWLTGFETLHWQTLKNAF